MVAASVADCAITATEVPCVRYVGNYDGDTFSVEIPTLPGFFRGWQVRVRGIDAPEIRGTTVCEKKKATEVKALTHELLKTAKSLKLKNVGKDKYFRLLADVELDGDDLKALLLKEGAVVRYDGGTKPKFVCPRK